MHALEPSHRFFAGHRAALTCIASALRDARELRIATAYFEASGYQVLQEVLAGKQVRLLVGRPEGGEDNLREVLEEFIRDLAQGPLEHRTRAMRQLLVALERGQVQVVVGEVPTKAAWMDARFLYHHAKLYIADRRAVVVTSANLSYHGLCVSREAGITVTDPDDVAFFVHWFDVYFAQARSITAALIEALRAWLKAYDPYVVYARALLELYGLPDEQAPAQLPPLAEYQKGVASSVLRALLEHQGAFLVASTGLGKTIIAAHVAAYLRMQGEIETAIVVCPAGLREVWRRWMRAARVPSVEFSYFTLTTLDKERDSSLPILEHELRQVDERTLIILDESHRLRNEEQNGGDLRLSNQRIQQAVRESRGKVLLQTATPYGRDISEVESQLHLLPAPTQPQATALGLRVHSRVWQVERLADLADLPPCTVLTTPDVVHHFGEVDAHGNRFVRFGEEKRYFPRRIRLVTIRYKNPFDDFFADLLESKLLYRERQVANTVQQQLALPLPDGIEAEGERMPLQEALFLHQFCSSPAEVLRVCEKMERNDYKYRFARPKALREFIRSHRELLHSSRQPHRDPKLQHLVRIIQEAGEQKVVVFCEYLETAHYVTEGLRRLLPRVTVETTVGASNLDHLLQRFAPIANEVLPEERRPEREVQVLVASRAMAEGFNLQDASILVNYDLPWTVLQLAQRMGRILRPWHRPRDITIYNFVPSTMEHERIRHARKWKERLERRSREHRSLAQIPVLVYEESRRAGLSREFEMEALAQAMYLAEEDHTDLNLDQVMEFIQAVDDLTTSTFYKDLAMIPNPDAIRSLPEGIRSAMKSRGNRRLFLLLRRGRRVDTVLADGRGRVLEASWRRDEVMRTIRCFPDTPKADSSSYPEDDAFDVWIERARQSWAEHVGVEPHRLRVVCALALLP